MHHSFLVPEEVLVLFKEHFAFPEKPLFGSVATVYNNSPRTRTMRLYELNQEGCPVLITHTGSNKWKEFVANSRVSINIVSESKLVQIICSGSLVLVTKPSAEVDIERYWNMVRPDVRKIYDSNHKIEEAYREIEGLSVSQEAPETFGVACVIPDFWEVLSLESEYTKSHRHQYNKKEGAWQKQRIHVG